MPSVIMHPKRKRLAIYEHNQESQLVFYYPQGINLKILQAGYGQLDAMISYYSKVTVIIIQLHQFEYSAGNQQVSLFFKKLIKKLKAHYNCKVGYIWRREQEEAESQHYHAAIFLNGHKCNSSYIVDELTRKLWTNINPSNFAYRTKNRIYKAKRRTNDEEPEDKELRAAKLRLSYFAKSPKNKAGGFTQIFNASRLKPNVK